MRFYLITEFLNVIYFYSMVVERFVNREIDIEKYINEKKSKVRMLT